MERTNFENLIVYKLAENLSDTIWNVVYDWNVLAKNTISQSL